VAALSKSDHDTISQAWELSGDLLASLQTANTVYESEKRTQLVDQLTPLQQQILDLGFFEKTDFTDQERTALLDAASQIGQAQDAIKDSHELTLMELTIDLAQLIQKLSLSEYESMLRAKWLSARRPVAAQQILPQDIPGEVRDDFTVGLFSMMQGNLNQHSARVKAVQEFGCLNSDDYSSQATGLHILSFGALSADSAINNYVDSQVLRSAAAAAKPDDGPSVLGEIWSVIGWDSPTDFLKDAVIMAVTGGASKVLRWGKRLAKAVRRVEKIAATADKFLEVEERARRGVKRLEELAAAAKKIRSLRKIGHLLDTIETLFKQLEAAERQVKAIKVIGAGVTKKALQGVVSTLAARAAGSKDLVTGSTMTNELARQAVMNWLDGSSNTYISWLSTQIKERRSKLNLGVLILSDFSAKWLEQFFEYFWLFTAREFLVRLALSVIRKVDLTLEIAVNEFIAAFAAALENVLWDIPFMDKDSAGNIARTIVSSVRKVLVVLAQKVADPLLA
jgi:hypothetical protein